AVNAPLLLLVRQDNEDMFFARTTNWSATAATATIPTDAQPGVYWARILTAALPGVAKPLTVALNAVGQPCGAAAGCASGFCVGSVCCDAACSGGCNSCAGGHCGVLAKGTACSSFVCDGASASCPTSCNASSDCIAADYCVN